MPDTVHFFTTQDGNLLIRLLLAHLAADFLFQTDQMVNGKKWFSKPMLLHILLVFGLTALLSGGLWLASIVIAVIHWLTDGLKITLQKKHPRKEAILFIADQLLHVAAIVLVWTAQAGLWQEIVNAAQMPFLNFRISLLLLAYGFVIWPLGYLIKFALPKITSPTSNTVPTTGQREDIERGGRIIGQFERIIILTFVLLGQYEAIGFLITGKSIIRFAQHNENLRSEYVLVGTMISFGLSIITGELLRWLLTLAEV